MPPQSGRPDPLSPSSREPTSSEPPRAKALPLLPSSAPPQARAKTLPLPPPPETALPDLLPARMLNELLYCERLFYLEWVQSEWEDNRYTLDGKAVHRRVDRRAQELRSAPASEGDAKAQEEEKPYSARAVWLSSESSGLTARLDIVEVEGNQVVPIEYKRGKEPPAGPWLPERAQVAVQVFLLREAGYQCEGGEIYYSEERKRVPVPYTTELEETVRGAVKRAREIAGSGLCPPPLEDSPKCHGCSLAGICLPDEVRFLHTTPEHVEEEEEKVEAEPAFDVGEDPWSLAGPEPDPQFEPRVRRLFPARDEKIPLYVQGQGASLRLSGERIIIQVPHEKPVEARIPNTSSVTLYGNVQVTAQALRRLMEEGIPILFASTGGWLIGRALGMDTKNVELRAAQYRGTQDPQISLQIARAFIQAKVANCRVLLRRNHPEPPAVALKELQHLGRKITQAPSLETLLGLEGAAARVYFREFDGLFKTETGQLFVFDQRNRRPPRDPVNALLSFCYSLLLREVTIAIQKVGLDPLLGFYHQPRFGRPSLALDLMEEFRPLLADSTVLSVLNTGIVKPEDFTRGQGAVSLQAPARRRVTLAMERRMNQLITHPIFDYRLSYRRVLEIQARLLSRVILGELEHYPGFRVR